ncbi:hypothetical protein BJ875DRAFT_441384 [Amylocarpus encephaloides]|uniref:Uncharacterized protein n=1 Tax=Amylocarpus encephaloides TaxID=45428 RepID=A0A9P7YI77_9HELO|nr:hypothetical protein BJ875DRAFT_441384 [Amylocarpus encephaloides]
MVSCVPHKLTPWDEVLGDPEIETTSSSDRDLTEQRQRQCFSAVVQRPPREPPVLPLVDFPEPARRESIGGERRRMTCTPCDLGKRAVMNAPFVHWEEMRHTTVSSQLTSNDPELHTPLRPGLPPSGVPMHSHLDPGLFERMFESITSDHIASDHIASHFGGVKIQASREGPRYSKIPTLGQKALDIPKDSSRIPTDRVFSVECRSPQNT